MMTLAEKTAIIVALGSTTLLTAYTIIKPRIAATSNNAETINKRNEILKKENVKVLFSTMSFFYLQSYRQTSEDLKLLKDILNVAKPKLVALQISEKEMFEDYQPILRNPSFKEAIKKVDYYLDTNQDVSTITELDLRGGLENLYAMDFCQKNRCKIVCANESQSFFDQLFEAKMRLKEATQNGAVEVPAHLKELYAAQEMIDLTATEDQIKEQINEKKAEVFVEKLMTQMTPSFSLVPEVPYKVIVGVVAPQTSKQVVANWKQRFMTVYGHEILEDETIQ